MRITRLPCSTCFYNIFTTTDTQDDIKKGLGAATQPLLALAGGAAALSASTKMGGASPQAATSKQPSRLSRKSQPFDQNMVSQSQTIAS